VVDTSIRLGVVIKTGSPSQTDAVSDHFASLNKRYEKLGCKGESTPKNLVSGGPVTLTVTRAAITAKWALAGLVEGS
jgi:hypothetical protein